MRPMRIAGPAFCLGTAVPAGVYPWIGWAEKETNRAFSFGCGGRATKIFLFGYAVRV